MKLYEYLIYVKNYAPDESAKLVHYYELGLPLNDKWFNDLKDYWDYRESLYYDSFVNAYLNYLDK